MVTRKPGLHLDLPLQGQEQQALFPDPKPFHTVRLGLGSSLLGHIWWFK